MVVERLALYLAASALLIALLVVWTRRARLRRRLARGAQAERDAVVLARRAGYRVVATQIAGTASIRVDGRQLDAAVRADLLLSKWGRRYIGEVKSGRRAPDPTDRATRRQLLEYSQAFDADGLLLFDMQARQIRRIEFPRRRRARWPVFVGIGLGMAVGWIAHASPIVAAWVRNLARALGLG